MNKTVKAIVEGGGLLSKVNGKPNYTVRMDTGDLPLDYWIMGDGYSIEEAVRDFLIGYQEMKEAFGKRGEYFQELFFEFESPSKMNLPAYLIQNKLTPTEEIQVRQGDTKYGNEVVFM